MFIIWERESGGGEKEKHWSVVSIILFPLCLFLGCACHRIKILFVDMIWGLGYKSFLPEIVCIFTFKSLRVIRIQNHLKQNVRIEVLWTIEVIRKYNLHEGWLTFGLPELQECNLGGSQPIKERVFY